nr:reverse transcriptase domain-containing protein [Tanacetum cinerariifolium]
MAWVSWDLGMALYSCGVLNIGSLWRCEVRGGIEQTQLDALSALLENVTLPLEKERVVELEDALNREGSRVERNNEGGRPLRQRTEDNGSQRPSNRPIPLYVNPYPQPNMRAACGQPMSHPFQAHEAAPPLEDLPPITRIEDMLHRPPQEAASLYLIGSYTPRALSGLFADYTGSVTLFVHWIEDYPLPDGLKIPSHVGSYDRKRDPTISCTSLKVPFICINGQYPWPVICSPIRLKISPKYGAMVKRQKDRERTRAFVTSLVEFLSTDLPTSYKGLMEKTYIWIEEKEVATNGTPNDRREDFERFKRDFSWDNNKGKRIRDRFSLYRGGILRTIMVEGKSFNMEHKLNDYKHVKPIKQKRRGLDSDRNEAACRELEELTRACFLRKQQIQMAEEDEDKTAFFIGKEVFCYRKMPFELKDARTTYQRLVDKVFGNHIGRNVKAYVDDIGIKSTSEEDMLQDIQETFNRFSIEGKEYTYTLCFEFKMTYNEAEYKALLARLWIAQEMEIKSLAIFTASQLMANQIKRIFEAWQPTIKQYLEKVKEVLKGFDTFTIKHVKRNQNKKANALSKLASKNFKHLTKEVLVEVLAKSSINNKEVSKVKAERGEN